jgi:hypothetical protein
MAGAILLAAPFFAALPARADTVVMAAHLFGSGNVPVTKSDAFGEAQFSYDTATRRLDYFVSYDGLVPTKIDLHGPAGATETVPALIGLPVTESPLNGQITLTPEQASALLAGRLYIDIHSKAFADGEIRGQIQK